MPRQIKSKTEVTETTPAVNAVTTTTTTVSAVEKKTKVPKVKAAPAVNVESSLSSTVPTTVVDMVAAVTTTAAVTDTVVDTTTVEAELSKISTEYLAKLNQISSIIASLKTEFRSYEKKCSREIKTAQKTNAKRKRKSGNRQPSGFVKPTKISDELAKFLEKPVGSEMARTDVTREINKYIRSHSLQDKENGRKINPDAKLQTLLKLKKTDELTYFNLQRYMSPHFAKSEKALAAAAASAAASTTV